MIYGYSKYKNAFAKFSDETHPIYPRKLLAQAVPHKKSLLRGKAAAIWESENSILCSSGLNFSKGIFKHLENLMILRDFSFEIFLDLKFDFEYYIFSVFLGFLSKETQRNLLSDNFMDGLDFQERAKVEQQAQLFSFQSKMCGSLLGKYKNLRNYLIKFKDIIECQTKQKETHVYLHSTAQKFQLIDSLIPLLNHVITIDENNNQVNF